MKGKENEKKRKGKNMLGAGKDEEREGKGRRGGGRKSPPPGPPTKPNIVPTLT